MQAQSLTPVEARLLHAFRMMPIARQQHLFRAIEELAEDEQDAAEATRILERIRSEEEETISFDEVVKNLGLVPKNRGKA